MKYLLVEPQVKAIAPNIALMKWARWCDINGHSFAYIRGNVKINFIPDQILISCIFTYYADVYEKTIDLYTSRFPGVPITVGGVFPSLYPEWFNKEKWSGEAWYGGSKVTVFKGLCPEIEQLPPKYNININFEGKSYPQDKIVLYSSRGCPNKCAYCAVPRLEGKMHSFKSIRDILEVGLTEIKNPTSIVLYDNNFTEHLYFDTICDEIIETGLPVDIHGLHVESFNEHHAKKFAEMKFGSQSQKGTAYLRFSFDKLKYANNIERSLNLVKKYKIGAQFFCYMLFNFTDSPDDFWDRIMIIQNIVDKVGKTIYLFPQRYEPIGSLKRNNYIGKHWSARNLRNLVQMYSKTHNFLAITRSRNIYNLIGDTKQDFLNKINN